MEVFLLANSGSVLAPPLPSDPVESFGEAALLGEGPGLGGDLSVQEAAGHPKEDQGGIAAISG